MSFMFHGKYLLAFFIFSQLCICPTIQAARGVKFDRLLNYKNKKIKEEVFLSTMFMRVEGLKYIYVIDIEDEYLTFQDIVKNDITYIPFSTLHKQYELVKKDYEKINEKTQLKVENTYKKYKRFNTILARIIPPDKKFITLRLLHDDRKEIIIKKFYQNLFNKLGFIPAIFDNNGLIINDPVNEIFFLIAHAFSYDKIKISNIPIFIFRPFYVIQIEILNISSESFVKEDFFRNLKRQVVHKRNLFQKFWDFISRIYVQIVQFFKDLFGGESKPIKKPEIFMNKVKKKPKKIAPKVWKDTEDSEGKKYKSEDIFEYSLLWSSKDCVFFTTKKDRLVLLVNRGNGFLLDKDLEQGMQETYQEVLKLIGSVKKEKYTNFSRHIDNYLYKKFKKLMYFSDLQKVRVEKSSLIRDNKLCYLKSRLYKVYMHIKTNY